MCSHHGLYLLQLACHLSSVVCGLSSWMASISHRVAAIRRATWRRDTQERPVFHWIANWYEENLINIQILHHPRSFPRLSSYFLSNSARSSAPSLFTTFPAEAGLSGSIHNRRAHEPAQLSKNDPLEYRLSHLLYPMPCVLQFLLPAFFLRRCQFVP